MKIIIIRSSLREYHVSGSHIVNSVFMLDNNKKNVKYFHYYRYNILLSVFIIYNMLWFLVNKLNRQRSIGKQYFFFNLFVVLIYILMQRSLIKTSNHYTILWYYPVYQKTCPKLKLTKLQKKKKKIILLYSIS